MADDIVNNNSKAQDSQKMPIQQDQPSEILQGTAQPSQPINEGEFQQQWSNAPLNKNEGIYDTTFQGTPKQQSEAAAYMEESKERGLPGSAPVAEKADNSTSEKHSKFFQQELGAAQRNFTTCSDEEGNYSLGPSTEKDLVGNLLTPSNEDLQPVTDDDGHAQSQFNMFTGSDQHQQPIGDQELKLKKAQIKSAESQNDLLSRDLVSKTVAQVIEYGTESGSRQLSITEQTITYGDIEQDQINRMFDPTQLVSQETDQDAHKDDLRLKEPEADDETQDDQSDDDINMLNEQQYSDDQQFEENKMQILGSTYLEDEQNRHSTPEKGAAPQDSDKHFQDISSALKPDDEETQYSGQKLDGLSVCKQRSKSMKHDEPSTSANYTASGKKQKKRVPFYRLFTKRSGSREAEQSALPQEKHIETFEKNEDELPSEMREKEVQPGEQQTTQITNGKQKDKKGGSRFFNLFRSKKSKAKDSDAKPEQEEQAEESPEQLHQQPPGSNDANDLDQGFRESQGGSSAEEECLPTKLEKADFIPQHNKGRSTEKFQRNLNSNEALNVVTNYNSHPDARSTVDRKNSNWGSDAASGSGLNSRANSLFDENPNQILSQVSQANNNPIQYQQQYDFWQDEQHADDHAQGQGLYLTTIESECPFSFEKPLDDNYIDTGLSRLRAAANNNDNRYDFVFAVQQNQQQPEFDHIPEQWSSQARQSESNSNFGKDEIKPYQIGSQNSYNTPNSQWPTTGANSGEGVSSNSTGNEYARTRTTGSWRGRGCARPFMNVSVDQGNPRGRYSNLQPEPAPNSIFVHETRSQNDTLFDKMNYREQFADADGVYSAGQQYAGSNSSLSNHQQFNQSDHYSNTAANNANSAYGSGMQRKTSHDLIAFNSGQLCGNDLLSPQYSPQVQVSPNLQPIRNNFTGQPPSDFNQQQQPHQQQPNLYYNQQMALVQHQMANFKLDQPNHNSRSSNPFQQNQEFSQQQNFTSQQFLPQIQHSYSEIPIGYPQQPVYHNVRQGGGRNSEPTYQPQMYQPPNFQPMQQHQQTQQHFLGTQMQNTQGAFFTPQQTSGAQFQFNNLQSPLPQPVQQYQGTPSMPHTYSNPGKPPLPSLGGNGRNSTSNLHQQNASQSSLNQKLSVQQQKKSVHSEQHCQSCSCRGSHLSSQSQEIHQAQSAGQKAPMTPFERLKKMIVEEQKQPNQQYHSFSSSGSPPTTLKDMLGFASDFCRDQQCSRFIQEQIRGESSAEDKNAFFAEICKDEEEIFNAAAFATSGNRAGAELLQPPQQSLMRDVFGNFVVQMILEYGNQERIDQLFNCIILQVPELSLDKYGCRVIQKAFEVLPEPRQGMLISKFDQQMLVKCMYNTQGNHVIQRMITKVPHHMTYFIVELARVQVVQLCKDENGCRIVQRIMERFPRNQIVFITEKILSMIQELTTHEFGNYVITHILEHGALEEQCLIIDEIIDDIVPHSLHKFGSNVVEKCLQFAPDCRKDMILDRIVGVQVANSEYSLAKMIDNEFANYVVQSAFDISDDQKRSILVQKIQQVIHSGQINPKKGFAKHVLNKLEQRYRISFTTQQPLLPPEFDMQMEESKKHRSGGGRHHQASGQSSRHSQSSQSSMNSNANSATGGTKGRKPQGSHHNQQHSPQFAHNQQYSGQPANTNERDGGPPQSQRQNQVSNDQPPQNQSNQQKRRKNNKSNRKNNAGQQSGGKTG